MTTQTAILGKTIMATGTVCHCRAGQSSATAEPSPERSRTASGDTAGSGDFTGPVLGQSRVEMAAERDVL
ncbi:MULTISPECIES: hypothetical protein [Micrococcaceae]|uniref:hypothetical protein n=1 Tax=Micrococcaceae TaxID=1268 RepID=UPI001036CCB5|nr:MULTISPECIES: hypothetical protein [Micrococcaceae]TAP25943.1 hypothetical protein EYR88_13420 [Arthrobacter sp. S41]UXN31864.1 hypothetical protein N6V40_16480 [Glutamicibacter sp. M10]